MTNEQRNSLQEQIEALQSLLTHPGWNILCKRIRAQADQHMTNMKMATSQESLLKATYTYLALHDLPEAPETMLRVLTQQLQTTRK